MIVESYEDVVVLSGALRRNFWKTIHTAISLTLQRHPQGVIVDCSRITEATAEGAQTFQDAIDFVSEHERARILFAGAPPHVMEVLMDVPELRSQLAMADSVEGARASLDLVEAEEGVRRKKRVAKAAACSILAVMQGQTGDQEVIRVAKDLAGALQARVVVLMPVILPRDLAISAPMPEREAALKLSAELAERMIDGGAGSSELRLERGRSLAAVIAQVSSEIGSVFTLVGVEPDPDKTTDARQILEQVQETVLFVRAALPGARNSS
jgi:hypothetical protein